MHRIILVCLLAILPAGRALLRSKRPAFVILPGFGNDAVDYVDPLGRGQERGMVSLLAARGVSASVVPVERPNWFNVFLRGALSLDFWLGRAAPEVAFGWYLDLVRDHVRDVLRETDADRVVLVGHSAGGWLGRCALGAGEAPDLPVAALVTLGCPHLLGAGAMDQTRGAVGWTNEKIPGTFHDSVSYISIAGEAVVGDSAAERGSIEKYAAGSYQMLVGGDGEVMGDAVVPLEVAHLPGAKQITLAGCWHSINAPENLWYGGDAFMDAWLEPTLKAVDGSFLSR